MNAPATSSLPTVPPSQLLSEHLTLMVRQSTAVFGGNYVMAAVSVMALWTVADHARLLGWATLVYLLTTGRIVLTIYFRRNPPTPTQALRWAWAFTGTSALSGILWGAMGLLFFDPSHPLSVLYIGWALAGMMTAAVPTLSNFLPAYAGFALPAALPYAAVCFAEGSKVYLLFGFLTLYFIAANMVYARSAHRSTAESIRLRFENLALLQQLQIAKEHAESANSAKTKFLAAASHDLRQPTHALGLFLGAMERLLRRADAAGNAGVLAIVERMKTTLKGLGNLLSSLLDTSRLEAGAVKVERGTIQLQDLFDALKNEFQESARNKGLTLHFHATRMAAGSDPLLLRRILSNLIANAIKYSDTGRVVVGCRRRARDIELQVIDRGIGIAIEHRQTVFEEFVQLGNAERNHEQGLGLGLSIVRRTAQLLGHELGLRSEPGRGSTFWLRVPRTEAGTAKRAVAARIDEENLGGAVIVIDDNDGAREAVEQLLRAHGYDVVAASSIEDIRKRIGDTAPEAHMIVADYRLGNGATGVDAIAAIQPLLARPVPAIIITGDTSPERIREAQASGYPLLHKPLDAATLLAALQSARV